MMFPKLTCFAAIGLLSMLTSAPAGAQSAGKSCPAGQLTSADTAGNCCWPGQVWSKARKVCVGVPQCPNGLAARGETCAVPECPPGAVATVDTAGHCCWPDQAWSHARSACVGTPRCPTGLVAVGEMCAAPAPAPPPPTAPPPPAVLAEPKAPPPREVDDKVPVRFQPAKGHATYTVAVSGADTCTTPCTLRLKPGLHSVTVEGAGKFESLIAVPANGATVRLSHLRGGLGAGGTVMLTFGVLGMSGGAGWLVYTLTSSCTGVCSPTGPAAVLSAGSTLLIGGIIMLAFSGQNRADVMPGAPVAARPPAVRFAGLGVDVSERRTPLPVATFEF